MDPLYDTESISYQKSILRKEMLTRLKSFDRKEQESKVIVNAILSDKRILNSTVILSYYPLKTEVDLTPLLTLDNVLTPYIENNEMHFSRSRVFSKSTYGFMEPLHNREDYDNATIIVPLLAFDRKRNRLGRGKGFYDRYLKSNNERLFKVGVAFSISEVSTVPTDSNDIPLDLIITSNGYV